MSSNEDLSSTFRRVWDGVFASSKKPLPEALEKLLSNLGAKSVMECVQKCWTDGRIPPQVSLFAELHDRLQLPCADLETVILEGSCTSVGQVVDKYFPQWWAATDMRKYANRLFEQEPALVTAYLITNEDFPFNEKTSKTLSDLLRSYPTELNFLLHPPETLIKKVNAVLQPSSDDDDSMIIAALHSLHALGRIIVEPYNLTALMAQGYTSIEGVAYMSLEPFCQRMLSSGVSKEHAIRIHNQAISTQVYSEQTWMTMLQGNQPSFATNEASLKRSEQKADTKANSHAKVDAVLQESRDITSGSENLSDWFGDLDEVACDECCSVTSPAAYLVDLLRLLEVTPCQLEITKTGEPGSGSSNILANDVKKDTLLTRLFERRPDIGDLLLSCHNSKEIVPYIDLANEVMESTVKHLERERSRRRKVEKMTIKPFDADGVGQQHGVNGAQNTQFAIYDEYISQRIFPANTFPFDHGMVAFEKYLMSVGVSLDEVCQTFWSQHHEMEVSKATLLRVHSANILGLSDVDFVALTGESIWSLLLKPEERGIAVGNNHKSPIKKPAYWGYEDENDEATMLDDKKGEGLPFIKEQLLPRLGINFETLVGVLRTKFLNSALVVALMPDFTKFDRNRNVPTQLNDFRLRCNNGSGELNVDECHRLGQFVRLMQRLGWSVTNLDDALVEFGEQVDKKLVIAPETIAQIAALEEIEHLSSGSDMKRVIAMWASEGEYMRQLATLKGGNRESTYSVALFLANIEMGYQDYLHVKSLKSLEDALDTDSMFWYHRLTMTAKLFDVPVEDVEPLLELLGQKEPWNTPVDMLAALKVWLQHKRQGFDLPALKEAVDLESGSQISPDFREKTHAFLGNALESCRTLNETSSDTSLELIRATLARNIEEDLLALFPNDEPATVKALFHTKLNGADRDAVSRILDQVVGITYQSFPIQIRTNSYIITSDACGVTFSTELAPMSIQKNTLTLSPDITHSTRISIAANSSLPGGSNDSIKVGIVSLTAVNEIETQLSQIKCYASIASRIKLTAPEIAWLFGPDKVPWKGTVLQRAMSYAEIRENLLRASPRADIQKFLRFAQKTTQETPASDFAEGLRLSEPLVEAVLDGFPCSTSAKRREKGQSWIDEDFLSNFAAQIQLLGRLSLVEDAVEMLRGLVIPLACQKKTEEEEVVEEERMRQEKMEQEHLFFRSRLGELLKASQLAKGLKDAVRGVEDKLRVHRRRALVQYLLQDPYFKSQPDVYDADGLFEFFLIDVQMGSELETSRIKQAISTVQLFVQRCLLGQESAIDGRVIDRSRWAWMHKFNLWEASRKVFLYPENWADPSLRDNKTEPFKALETSLLQKNPDDAAISKLIRKYVYEMVDIANLRLESFFWDRVEAKGEGTFHFFARTRTTPAQFYYRQLEYLSKNSTATTKWTAWQRIPLEIRVFDMDSEGVSLAKPGSYVVPACWGSRVFLFLPQILTRVVPIKGAASQVTFQSGSEKSDDQKEPAKISFGNTGSNIKMNIEIKMTWSEYVEGAWTAPVQAQDFIKIEEDGITPDLSKFQFLAEVNDKALALHVLRQTNKTANANTKSQTPTDDNFATTEYEGRFEFRGAQLVVLKDEPVKTTLDISGEALITSYGQLSTQLDGGPENVKVALKNFGKKTDETTTDAESWAVVVKPSLYTEKASGSVTWTFDSALPKNALGLVGDFATTDRTGNESWFTLPLALVHENQGPDSLATPFFNPLSDELRKALSDSSDLEKLYQVMDEINVQPLKENKEHYYSTYEHSFGRFRLLAFCNEKSTPYSLYNWEIGFHVISLIVERLMALQQFDLALNYARFVFDPTLSKAKRNQWRFPPFRDDNTRQAGTLDAILDGLNPSTGHKKDKRAAILEWEENAFSPHIVARSRPLAYMKRFVMKYIEALIASGDSYFRQNSLESVPLAIQRYVEASHVLGPAPHKVPKVGEIKFQSYNSLKASFNDFSNASTGITLASPYFIPLDLRGLTPTSTGALQGFLMTKYFGVTPNPEFAALRVRVDDRLQKIRASLDINGNRRRLSINEPHLDPDQLVKTISEKGSLTSVLSLFEGPLPRHRFQYLFQKALDLCGDLKMMSSTLLTTIEKRDAEALQALRSCHDTSLQQFIIQMKVKQRLEVEKGIEHLEATRASAVSRMNFYIALTGDHDEIKPPAPNEEFEDLKVPIAAPSTEDPLRLTSDEAREYEYAEASRYNNHLAINQDFWAALFFSVPMPSINGQPCGVGMSWQPQNIGHAFQVGASELRAEAGLLQEDAQRSGRLAQFTRQLQDRRLQINLAGHEIKSIDKQIEAQRAHLAVIDHDTLSQQKQADNALAVEEFLRTKFTNTELYSWLEATSRALLYQIYILAIELAKKAEKSFAFETGVTSSFIHAAGYWDDKRNGFECGEQLWLALKKMELAHADIRPHDFEIVKNVSLRQLSADCLLKLRANGDVTFKLPEEIFDLDFPGHYARRIKSIGVSFHCVAGPYTSINGTLSLESHTQRVTANNPTPYGRVTDVADSRFTPDDIKLPISAIAISSGQQDSGVFNLDFRSTDYQPFEGAGAISTWRLRLPGQFKQFDYNTISDVVLHLRYTAKEGTSDLREAAVSSLTTSMNTAAELSNKFGLNTMISVRSDYPQAWYALSAHNEEITQRSISLTGLRSRLPFFTRSGKTITLKDITVYLSAEGTAPAMSLVSTLSNSDPKQVKSRLMKDNENDKLGTMHKFRMEVPDPKSKKPISPVQSEYDISRVLSQDEPLHVVLQYPDGNVGKIQDMLVILEYTMA